MNRIRLGLNIDHVATVRQARGGIEPDPVRAALLAELGGADSITVHLREDRRHIQERDVRLLRGTLGVPLNLELAVAPDVVALALELKPEQATLVPERREELTTEGGLDVAGQADSLEAIVDRLKHAGVRVATFIEPDAAQVRASAAVGARAVEFHTGRYALARGEARDEELDRLADAADLARDEGLDVHAGHGLDYQNIHAIAAIPLVQEVNIGHSIISRAVFQGLEEAVREMRRLLDQARGGGR